MSYPTPDFSSPESAWRGWPASPAEDSRAATTARTVRLWVSMARLGCLYSVSITVTDKAVIICKSINVGLNATLNFILFTDKTNSVQTHDY
jgi:hypothetical protein